jgi:hypothetical protein
MVAREEGYVATAVEVSGVDPPACRVDFTTGASLNSKGEAAAAEELLALTKSICRGNEAAFARFYDLYSFRLYKSSWCWRAATRMKLAKSARP